ncbi:hypothetical protein, partial [Pseudomonas fluorescens]
MKAHCGSWLACCGGLSEYISVAAVMADIGSALTAIPFKVFDKIPQNASQGTKSMWAEVLA